MQLLRKQRRLRQALRKTRQLSCRMNASCFSGAFSAVASLRKHRNGDRINTLASGIDSSLCKCAVSRKRPLARLSKEAPDVRYALDLPLSTTRFLPRVCGAFYFFSQSLRQLLSYTDTRARLRNCPSIREVFN